MTNVDFTKLDYPSKLALWKLLESKKRQTGGDTNRWHKYINNPIGFVNQVLGEFIWSKQREVLNAVLNYDRVSVKSCHSSGKALSLDTRLPTPSGWTTMGDVSIGDSLLSEQGKSCKVIGKSEIQNKPCYKIIFDDKSEIIAAADHQWCALDFRTRATNRKRGYDKAKLPNWRELYYSNSDLNKLYYNMIIDWRNYWDLSKVVTTEQIANSLKTAWGQTNWSIPCAESLVGNSISFDIEPYTFGAWLGDGTSIASNITIGHIDSSEMLREISSEGVSYRSIPSAYRETTGYYHLIGFRKKLLKLGILGNKHIPEIILRADFNTRLSVLQGLMDTGGFVDTVTKVRIDLTNKKLADSLRELIHTFGWKTVYWARRAKLYGKDCGPCYCIMFCPDLPVFRLDRKSSILLERSRIEGKWQSRRTHRVIKSCEYVGKLPVQCVEVDSPSHLYLAGDSFIPTHNSFIVARLAGWWIAAHRPGEAFVVTTAPTFAQVRAILWREINRVHRKGKLTGYVNQTEWHLDNGELCAFGRKPDDQQQTAFQGVHAKFILIILDEAAGVPGPIWNAAETLAANGGKIVAIGNPDDPLTEFKRTFDPNSGWHNITISAFSTPNFTNEEVPDDVRQLLVSTAWVDRYRNRWSESHPFYISKVLGEFPDVSADSLIPMSLVRAAVERHLEPTLPNELGVDLARYGNNESVIYHRRGSVARLHGSYNNRSLMELCGFIVRAIQDTGATSVKIDDVGMGGGVVDRLLEIQNETGSPIPRWVDIIPINVGLPPTDNDPETKKFANLKSELCWSLRERFERGDIDLDNDDDTVSQTVAMKYGVNSRGWLKVASKEDMQKELAEIETEVGSLSPDRFDALVLCFAEEIPGDKLSEWRMLANSR